MQSFVWVSIHLISASTRLHLLWFDLNSYLSQSHLSFDIRMIFDLWLISSLTWPDLWTNLIPALTSSLIENWSPRFYLTWSPFLSNLTQFPFLLDLGSVLTSALISMIFDLKLIFLNWSWFWQDLWSPLLLELVSLWFDWCPLWQPLWLETAVLYFDTRDTISNEAGKKNSI